MLKKVVAQELLIIAAGLLIYFVGPADLVHGIFGILRDEAKEMIIFLKSLFA